MHKAPTDAGIAHTRYVMFNPETISRLEIISNLGRELVYYGGVKDVSVQDQGRTIKIFLRGEPPRKPVQGHLPEELPTPSETSNPSVTPLQGDLKATLEDELAFLYDLRDNLDSENMDSWHIMDEIRSQTYARIQAKEMQLWNI